MGCKVEAHIVPGIREIWAPHTASGYYVGAAWEHYRCHDIHISDTRHTRVCSSVFFKHKYFTMPTLTAADALIRAADNLIKALAGVIPPLNMTTDAINQLINIFKTQAEKEKDKVTVQRVLKEQAATQRVRNKAATTTTSPPLPPLEVTYPDLNLETPRGVPVISQDNDPPAACAYTTTTKSANAYPRRVISHDGCMTRRTPTTIQTFPSSQAQLSTPIPLRLRIRSTGRRDRRPT
jgi:hypothetical protein